MATKLRRLAITELALVDEGDNPGAAITIAKRRADETPEQIVEPVPEPTTEISKGKETDMVFDINAIPEEFRKSVQGAIEAAVSEAVAKAKEPAPVVPAIVIPEAVQKQMDRQNDEIVKLRGELDARAEAETISKAKADFGAFSEVESIGKALYRLDKADPTLAADVRKALASAQAIARKTDAITKQVGKDGEMVAGSADDKLESLAKARMATEKISFAKAYAAVLNENPDLYTEVESATTRTVVGE